MPRVEEASHQRVVVVTGASTGIGRATTLLLLEKGYKVYAGLRSAADAESLMSEAGAAAQRLRILELDVTNEEQTAGAARLVNQELNGGHFHGLVNNAGIAVAGPMEFLPLDDLRLQFEVNVIGQVGLAQAFMPLLRERPGRLVFVGSVSGLIASRLLGAYAASKFGLEAVADAFRRELLPYKVRVSVVEPGRIATPIWQKSLVEGLDRMDRMPPKSKEYYGPLVQDLVAGAKFAAEHGTHPEKVAQAVHRALSARRSRTRYFVGWDAHLINVLRRVLSDPQMDRVVSGTGR
ncbi:MAG: SDR family oxidoreductase [Trueperaceae bacterium]|nr:SDR family oxidoreductase [Truepera sp.]HRN18956.1 SDR family oxidoreductase [Trueperaceae bacterium]HRQ10430.1 SDR family oxidoreductase [Trueperaceae bacterium]